MRIEKKVTGSDQQQEIKADEKEVILDNKGKLSFWIAAFFVLAIASGLVFVFTLREKDNSDILRASGISEESEPIYDIDLEPYGLLSDDVDFSEIDADVVYAYNPVTHQVFYERSPNKQSSIASITKLLTVLVSSEVYDIDTVLTAGKYDVSELYWVLELEEGDQMTYGDALHAMLLSSYNDVAFMVAENYPGGYQEFIKAMNDKAKKLGMVDSNFANPSGLDTDNHYSTARDLKKLVQKSLESDLIMNIVSKYSAQVEITSSSGSKRVEGIISTNQLLGMNSYIKGLKTGSTEKAGECFIGYWSAGDHDQLVTIILDSHENRFDETEELFELLKAIEYRSN